MKIAVLGGGNGSYAAAADFIKAGHEVSWWWRSFDDFSSRAKEEYSRLFNHTERQDLKIDHVTENIAKAVENAELIVCPTPAFAQLDIAELLAQHLHDG